MDMAKKAANLTGTSASLPDSIARLSTSVAAIRNAYEHIEDRALGTVFGKPDPVALTIFDHGALLREDTIVYGEHRLTLNELRTLISDTRQFLKDAAKGPRSAQE
jgi:chemotaxis regulatin CheY-phosphate phosphatase CheZ